MFLVCINIKSFLRVFDNAQIGTTEDIIAQEMTISNSVREVIEDKIYTLYIIGESSNQYILIFYFQKKDRQLPVLIKKHKFHMNDYTNYAKKTINLLNINQFINSTQRINTNKKINHENKVQYIKEDVRILYSGYGQYITNLDVQALIYLLNHEKILKIYQMKNKKIHNIQFLIRTFFSYISLIHNEETRQNIQENCWQQMENIYKIPKEELQSHHVTDKVLEIFIGSFMFFRNYHNYNRKKQPIVSLYSFFQQNALMYSFRTKINLTVRIMEAGLPDKILRDKDIPDSLQLIKYNLFDVISIGPKKKLQIIEKNIITPSIVVYRVLVIDIKNVSDKIVFDFINSLIYSNAQSIAEALKNKFGDAAAVQLRKISDNSESEEDHNIIEICKNQKIYINAYYQDTPNVVVLLLDQVYEKDWKLSKPEVTDEQIETLISLFNSLVLL